MRRELLLGTHSGLSLYMYRGLVSVTIFTCLESAIGNIKKDKFCSKRVGCKEAEPGQNHIHGATW
jgi:hypothetical protein